MRIAFFTDTFPPEVNGVANTAARAANALARKGHTVCVFTVSGLTSAELKKQNGGVYDVETISSIKLPIYLGVHFTAPAGLSLRKVARFKPDIIHSHTPFSMGWEAVWAARFLKVPLVGTHHTFFDHYLKHVHLDYTWAKHATWKLTVGYYNRCNLVVSPTRSLKEELQANGLTVPCEVIPNAVDTTLFSPAADKNLVKTKLNLPKKVVIHMGRLSYEKSIDQVIRAFAELVKKETDVVLVIAGDGPGKSDLEKLAQELNLGKSVRFTGFIYKEDLVQYLRASDVFVTASKSENMPLAVLEAMAAGLPIIAVRSLGLSEMVEPERNGYLLSPDDVQGISGHTLKLLQDEDLRKTFAKHSRELSNAYSEPTVTSRFEELYSRLIAERES